MEKFPFPSVRERGGQCEQQHLLLCAACRDISRSGSLCGNGLSRRVDPFGSRPRFCSFCLSGASKDLWVRPLRPNSCEVPTYPSFTCKELAQSPLATRSTLILWLLLRRIFAPPFTSVFTIRASFVRYNPRLYTSATEEVRLTGASE